MEFLHFEIKFNRAFIFNSLIEIMAPGRYVDFKSPTLNNVERFVSINSLIQHIIEKNLTINFVYIVKGFVPSCELFSCGRGGIFSSGILAPFKVRLNSKKLFSSTYTIPLEHFPPTLLYSDSVRIIILLNNNKPFPDRFCAIQRSS